MDDAQTPKTLRHEILTETSPERVMALLPMTRALHSDDGGAQLQSPFVLVFR